MTNKENKYQSTGLEKIVNIAKAPLTIAGYTLWETLCGEVVGLSVGCVIGSCGTVLYLGLNSTIGILSAGKVLPKLEYGLYIFMAPPMIGLSIGMGVGLVNGLRRGINNVLYKGDLPYHKDRGIMDIIQDM